MKPQLVFRQTEGEDIAVLRVFLHERQQVHLMRQRCVDGHAPGIAGEQGAKLPTQLCRTQLRRVGCSSGFESLQNLPAQLLFGASHYSSLEEGIRPNSASMRPVLPFSMR